MAGVTASKAQECENMTEKCAKRTFLHVFEFLGFSISPSGNCVAALGFIVLHVVRLESARLVWDDAPVNCTAPVSVSFKF
jgi:hypothetical protein